MFHIATRSLFFKIVFMFCFFLNVRVKPKELLIDDVSLNNFNDISELFTLVKAAKNSLNLEINNLEKFESYFLNLCDLLKQPISRLEKLEKSIPIFQNLNNLIDLSDPVIGLNKELREQVILLSDWIKFYLSSDEITLEEFEEISKSTSSAIEHISAFLKKKDKIINDKLLSEDASESVLEEIGFDFNTDNTSNDNTDNSDIPEIISDIKAEKSYNSNLDDEFSGAVNIEDKEIGIKKALDIGMRDLKENSKSALSIVTGIDYRWGGYPFQFVRQLLRYIDRD